MDDPNRVPNGIETRRQRGIDHRHTGIRSMNAQERSELRDRAAAHGMPYFGQKHLEDEAAELLRLENEAEDVRRDDVERDRE